MTRRLRIGTRGSPLALIQAEAVAAALMRAHAGLEADYHVVRTSGDRIQDRPLAEVGGKGLFTKEIEQALLDGAIDLAVHSMKDVETFLPDALCIAAMLPREDPRDVLLSQGARRLDDLPQGARIGTSSIRRQAQLLHRRPDFRIVPFRGNVETRLRKLEDGEAEATLLAAAGLKRLGRLDAATEILDPGAMLPAAGQGAIGIETRSADAATRTLLEAIDHPETAIRVAAERAMLAVLDGSCRTPIGALAELDRAGGTLTLQGLVARPDGSALHRREGCAAAADALAMAVGLGAELRSLMGEGFFR
ncbi:MAG: hydroxymethylbilane synthase [Alphaproteobacteria bacterium]|nr:hydroxymethylbilane synthase [Alphaproteobacteria bacterium]